MTFTLTSMPDYVPQHFSGLGEPVARVISLGAGVQSTVLTLMADKGLLGDIPEYAVFADTGWEPKKVYDHLDWLETELKNIEVLRVGVKYTKARRPRGANGQYISANLRDHLMAGVNSSGNEFITVPLYMTNKDGKPAIGRRQCTREYKITPIQKAIRYQILGLKPREQMPKNQWVEQWLGISTDEMMRMKDNRERWIINRWPLIEAADMNREDCKKWFKEHYPHRQLPRSACIGCPLRTHAEWLDMKSNDPESWDEAVAFDEALRESSRTERFGSEMYLTTKRVPLKDIEKVLISTRESKEMTSGMLQDECEGMCGV